MADDNSRGVPDKDPDVIDPVGDVADMFENAHVELSEGQDADELRDFIEAAENGDFGEIDAALEGQVRIARTILEDSSDE
jgi:hypothetical protein